jgi:hypothetical protein
MRTIYITNLEVKFIYENLNDLGHYDWYLILRCIEEMQCSYAFLSSLTWRDVLYNTEITNNTGGLYETYEIPLKLKDDINNVIALMDIRNLNQPICGEIPTVTAKLLYDQLCTYACIRHYQNTGFKFRIDAFGEYSVDKNGHKMYGQQKIEAKHEEELNKKIPLHSLYIAEWADKMEGQRPKGFELKFYDKKIGIAEHIGNRMEGLSGDKRCGGTRSPMFVRALRGYHLPIKECLKLEQDLHNYFEARCTGGEWFTDYEDDIIELAEEKIAELIESGVTVVRIDITKENEDITFLAKFDKTFWYKKLKEEIVDDGPEIYEV